MIINSVKIRGDDFSAVICGREHFGIKKGSSFYPEVKEWIEAGNTPEPEFTKDELDQQAQEKVNADAKKYLDDTDWYITRRTEASKPIPNDILEKRQQARDAIV
jgi:hypothetical protein